MGGGLVFEKEVLNENNRHNIYYSNVVDAAEISCSDTRVSSEVPVFLLVYAQEKRKAYLNSLEDSRVRSKTEHIQEASVTQEIEGSWKATRYGGGEAWGDSIDYNGSNLGCGTGYYDSNNTTIIAVGPDHYPDMPCGTRIRVCGAAGCIDGIRQDACPGCGINHIDLSEMGLITVCGSLGTCQVNVVKLP